MTKSVQGLTPLVCLALFTLPLSTCAAGADLADESAQEPGFTAEAGLATEYVQRGFRRSDGRPAAEAGIGYVHPSGWSAGTRVATVSDRAITNGSVEWEVLGGYSGMLSGVGYSLMGHYFTYPGAGPSVNGVRFGYGEISAGVSYKALYAKYNYTVTRNYFGIANARGTGYLDGGANIDLSDATMLNLHAGEGSVAGAGNDYWNWRDVKVGVTHSFAGGWKLSGAYTRAFGATHAYERSTTNMLDRSARIGYTDPGKNTFVVALSRTF